MPDSDGPSDDVADLPGSVGEPTITLPGGYAYGATRYADVVLQQAFPEHFNDLVTVLDDFEIGLDELQAGGGSKTELARRFDNALKERGWGKRNITIGKTVDGEEIARVRGHEIDMFKEKSAADPYPGVAVEMEWNNKDPFFDRDLVNYQALHREGVLAVGVVVTRGPELQVLLKKHLEKYGESSTHWNKLVPRVNLGGGGECPLLLIGIEPPRVAGLEDLDAGSA